MKLIQIVLLLLFFSCCDNKSHLDVFFVQLEQRLSSSQKEKLKKCTDVECINMFALEADSSFQSCFRKLPVEVGFLLDSIGIYCHRDLVLLIAYQKSINNQYFSIKEISESLRKAEKDSKQELEEYYLHFYQVRNQLAKTNFDKFSKGDTLSLLLPITAGVELPSVVYLHEYSIENFSDTLFLKCKLLEKEIEHKKEEATLGFEKAFFKVEVLYISERVCINMNDVANVGDKVRISVFDYGRPMQLYREVGCYKHQSFNMLNSHSKQQHPN